MRQRALAEKQRCLEIAVDQIAPVFLGDLTERSRIERRGVVDEDVESPCRGDRRRSIMPGSAVVSSRSAPTAIGRARPLRVELGD